MAGAEQLGWETVAAETSETHVVVTFRNPEAIAELLAGQLIPPPRRVVEVQLPEPDD